MRKLPHWVLTDKFPAFYDTESLTAVEQTARLYGAMQELIDEYNKFVDSLNSELENYEKGITEKIETFEVGVNQKFDDFIKVVELMFDKHTLEVTETINYIKSNTSSAISGIIKEMRENGELSEAVLNSFEETKNIINVLRAELEEDQEVFKEEVRVGVEEVRVGVEEFKTETNKKITELETVEKARKILYPELTQQQKDAIRNLAMSYYNNRSAFYYNDVDVTRNTFATNGCYTDEKTKFKLNCSMFAQFIFMGRDINDFKGKNADTYLNKITKAFDFGYYFEFKNRPLYGITKKDAEGNISGYYGFRKPHDAEGDYTSSFSYNSYYAQASERLYNQAFRSYMDACDMAFELQSMGCEIPRSELQSGDIVFTESTIVNDDNDSEFVRHGFKNITHVLIVSRIDENGRPVFIDCTDAANGETMPITSCGVYSSYDFDKLRGAYTEENIVMCARHPVAFGYTSNVPENIERI